MNRTHRAVALSMIAAALLVGCKKKAETAVTPVRNNPPPTETCDAACQAERARLEKERLDRARADSIARANEAMSAAKARAVASLKAVILFDYDQSDIRGDAKAVLDAKLPVLRANPGVRIRIAGHADERGSDDYNLALGQRRAAQAKRYLTDNGIDASRIDIVSYGEQRPAVSGADESAYAQNRRDEFEIVAGESNIVPPR